MTFVGKILVIVIMVFSLFFLAVSTVVFSTATTWKTEAEKRKTEIGKLNTEVSKLKNDVDARKTDLVEAKKQSDQTIALLTKEVKDAQEQTNLRQKEITDQRTEVEKSQESTNRSLAEAEARVKETGVIRDELTKVQNQANEYKLRQTELNDEIRVLKRELETATNNNKSLRDYLAVARGKIISLGFSDDFQTLKGGTIPPPPVEGEVDVVSTDGKKVEITIGSDDGLIKGHTLNVYRVGPNPTYIGQIKIISVDPDRAVGEQVGGKWNKGQKPQEHDIVASQIRSRG